MKHKLMISTEEYKKAKEIVKKYEQEQLNIPVVSEQLKCDCCNSFNVEILKNKDKLCKDCDRLWAF